MEGKLYGGTPSQGPSLYTFPNAIRTALGEEESSSKKDVHVPVNQDPVTGRQDGEYMPSAVPDTRNLSGPTPQRDSTKSTHYPSLTYGGTITVSQAPTNNASQNTASVPRRPATASETLTREHTMNGKSSYDPIQPA